MSFWHYLGVGADDQPTLCYLLQSRQQLGQFLLSVCQLPPSTEVDTKQGHNGIHYLQKEEKTGVQSLDDVEKSGFPNSLYMESKILMKRII